MATNSSCWFSSAFLVFLCFSSDCFWLIKAAEEQIHSHTVEVSSLLPSSNACSSIPVGRKRKGSLEVRHRYGPCSPLGSDKSSLPSHVEILEQDQVRVESIRNRVKPKSKSMELDIDIDRAPGEKELDLPAKSGLSIGTSNFIVTVGLGTPKKDLTLSFDTGSDITWTQCAPCVGSCYKQQDPIFDPTMSSTYTNITCKSPLCPELRAATYNTPRCSVGTCIYKTQYGDKSFSVGFFAKDTLYLSPHDSVPNFLFGCGEYNQGLFSGSAGLLGLGRNKLSAVSQLASKYGNYFSYCLPSKPGSTGHLTFGKQAKYSKGIQYIPMLPRSASPSFYFLELQGISVDGHKLSISPSVFSAGGTIIDSGTVISRFPPDAYSAMQAAFSKLMSKYPKAPAISSLLDTCYNLSGYKTVTIPNISLLFAGGAKMDLQSNGILYAQDLTQVCLAFAANSDSGDVTILGNVQQLTFDIIYDVAGGKLGFSPGGCM